VLAATDARNLAEAAKAAAKLGEIDKQLSGLSGNGRLEHARAYVRDQLKKLKLASIESV
jgi:MoxR-like ATPase